MATAETPQLPSEIIYPRTTYRRNNKPNDIGHRWSRFFRRAKKKPVLHMTLFFLLITLSVVIILVIVLTAWPAKEIEDHDKSNFTLDDHEDIIRFSITTPQVAPENSTGDNLTEKDSESSEDSFLDESTNRQINFNNENDLSNFTEYEDMVNFTPDEDLITFAADDSKSSDVSYFGNTSFHEANEETSVSYEQRVTPEPDVQSELSGIYLWNIFPTATLDEKLDNLSTKTEQDLDSNFSLHQQSEMILHSAYSPDVISPSLFSSEVTSQSSFSPDVLRPSMSFPDVQVSSWNETTAQLSQYFATDITSQISVERPTYMLQLSATLTLGNGQLKTVINGTDEWVPITQDVSQVYDGNDTNMSVQNDTKSNEILNTNDTQPTTYHPPIVDSSSGEHNFWSSLSNFSLMQSLINFPFLTSSKSDPILFDNITTDGTSSTSASFAQTLHIDDGSDYSIRYVIQVGSMNSVNNGDPHSKTSSHADDQPNANFLDSTKPVITTDPIWSTINRSEIESEIEHWPTSERVTSDDVTPIVVSSTAVDKTTTEKSIVDNDNVPTEVAFFPTSIDDSTKSSEQHGTKTSVEDTSKCRPRTLTFCDDVSPYNSTYLPNLAGAATEFEKWQLISYYNSIVDWNCNTWLKEYLCYILEPMCVDEVAVPPCNSLCKAAKKGCSKYITGSTSLESIFRCEVFPTSNAQILCAGLGNGEPCKQSEFRCSDTTCIPGAWWCDGVMDCEQGDDEKDCHPRSRDFKED